jgi:flagellar hook-associated protein 1
MSGTLSGFNTALSALRYNRVAMDVASGNIANVGTEGYARRRVEAQTAGAPVVPALWSRPQSYGDGVRVSGLTRMTDDLVVARQRTEHGNQSYLDRTAEILARVEAGIGEPSDSGVAASLADFRAAWHELANNPGSSAARSQMVARTSSLVEAVQAQATQVGTELADQRTKLDVTLAEANQVAADLAATNELISAGVTAGGDVSPLLDKRDQLGLRLAELTGAKAGLPDEQGRLDMTLNGVPLVQGSRAGRLSSDGGSPLTLLVTTGGNPPVAVPSGTKGELGAIVDVVNVTLPGYLGQLNTFARTLADGVNAQHALGFDATGAAGSAVFGYSAGNEAASLTLVLTDPALFAASGIAGGPNLDGGNADLLAGLTTADDSYQSLVNSFGSQVASLNRLAANQQVLTDQLDGSADQLAGVNLDEEMANMVTAQRAYEAASKVITVLDSVLDTLINRTGIG